MEIKDIVEQEKHKRTLAKIKKREEAKKALDTFSINK